MAGREPEGKDKEKGKRQEVRRKKHLWLKGQETAARPVEVLTILPHHQLPSLLGQEIGKDPRI